MTYDEIRRQISLKKWDGSDPGDFWITALLIEKAQKQKGQRCREKWREVFH